MKSVSTLECERSAEELTTARQAMGASTARAARRARDEKRESDFADLFDVFSLLCGMGAARPDRASGRAKRGAR